MQKLRWLVVLIVAAGVAAFALPVFADTITAQYCGGAMSAGSPNTKLCSPINDGTSARIGENGGTNGSRFWLGYQTPTSTPDTDVTLYIPGASECQDSININVHVMKRLLNAANDSNWSQLKTASSWQTGGGIGANDWNSTLAGTFDCSTSGQSVALTLDAQMITDLESNGTLGFVSGGAPAGYSAAWYTGITQLGGSYLTWEAAAPPAATNTYTEFFPTFTWGQSTSTGNGTATTTYESLLNTILGSATSSFPMCLINPWISLLDTFRGLSDGNLGQQTLVVGTKMGGENLTLNIDLGSVTNTTEGATSSFLTIIEMATAFFISMGWATFGVMVFVDLFVKPRETNVD